jgi:uroporphyrin-III C-methyltransferase/precorrin-2 dehydrogenase/sirohydrochlorin ferrochelatase
MSSFPAFLSLRHLPVLVIGGGENAARKIRLLLHSEAAVTVLALELNAELNGLAVSGAIQHRAEAFTPAALTGFVIVISADTAVNEAVAEAARARGLLINVVDRADLSDFTVPAIVRRGDITIGIASDGTAPMLASRIRAQIEALLPSRLGDLAKLAGDFRASVNRVLPNGESRRRFWRRVFDGPAATQALEGRLSAARETMLRDLNRDQGEAEGIVHIVGAGPGDPDLLTIAAQRALGAADIIYYDDLVAPAVLDRSRRDAERVAVGKRKGSHRITQDGINALLLESARQGRRVVRLKAGDPYIFGRGGEEVDPRAAHGIETVVVPGITAALGCAAAAGIPLTHRDLSSALTLVTGHGKMGEAALGWAKRVQAGETLVVYMGLTQAQAIRDALLGEAVSADLPVALIENGSRPDQMVSQGPLSDLPALAARHGSGPTLLVLGAVAARARVTMPAVAQLPRKIA